MTLQHFRLITLFAALLLSVATTVGFAGAPYLGSAYLMLVHALGDQFPRLTTDFALPLLRVTAEDPCRLPVTVAWVGATWGILFAGPWVAAYCTFRATDFTRAVAAWVTALVLYASITLVLALTVLAGIALPLTCL